MFIFRRSFPILATVLALAAPLVAHAAATDVNVTNPVYAPAQVIIPADALPVMQTLYLVNGEGDTTVSGEYDLVPVGYYLIIDYMALSAGAPSGQRIWGVLQPCYNLKGG